MEPDFYENINPVENKEKKELLSKMGKLLDESLDSFLEIRKRQEVQKIPIKKLSSSIRRDSLSDLFRRFQIGRRDNEINDDNNNNNNIIQRNRLERLERIRIMQEETENLERLLENDLEVIG